MASPRDPSGAGEPQGTLWEVWGEMPGRLPATAPAQWNPSECTVTHPYHPLRGQRFMVLKTVRICGKETFHIRAPSGNNLRVPIDWTDLAQPSHGVATGALVLRFDQLLALSELVRTLENSLDIGAPHDVEDSAHKRPTTTSGPESCDGSAQNHGRGASQQPRNPTGKGTGREHACRLSEGALKPSGPGGRG
jgi:hypothetical protein